MSDIVEIDADRTIVLAVTAHQEAMRQPLEEVRDQVAERLRLDETNALLAVSRCRDDVLRSTAGTDFHRRSVVSRRGS